MSDNIYIPPGGPPQTQIPSAVCYQTMGQENIERMIHDFYGELAESSIRGMFPEDMSESAHKSALFFVGFLGGPPLYQEAYGPPMLRARHLPFPITDRARKVWLACFDRILDRAVEEYSFPEDQLPVFRTFLHQFSRWMVNREI
ncbi:globin domain-containing protein [Salinispira pacifica]